MQIISLGKLVFVRILDQEVVVINDQHVAQDLLDKRSRIYSDRPYLATLKPCVSSILPFNQTEVRADMAGQASLHSRVMVICGVLADESSTKLSVSSLHSSFAQCRLVGLVR